MRIKFLILFYFTASLVMIIGIFGLFSSYKKFRFFLNLLTNSMLMSLKVTSKITVEVINHNKDNIDEGYLYASKHSFTCFSTLLHVSKPFELRPGPSSSLGPAGVGSGLETQENTCKAYEHISKPHTHKSNKHNY